MRAWAIAAVIGALLVIAGATVISGFRQAEALNSSQHAEGKANSAEERSTHAQSTASVGKEIAEAVAGERMQSILRTCQEQNARHTNSVAYLTALAHKEIHEAKPGKKRRRVRREALRGLGEFKLLFDALAPLQDCHALVAKSTR